MKTVCKFTLILLLCSLCSCVQKSYNRTIQFKLKVPGKTLVNAGVRGNDRPLNWNEDLPLTFDPADSTYKGSVTINTGYLFTEFKFVANGDFELKDQPNRRIEFNNRDTLVYSATFNSLK